ncbi:MAG: amidohydrolase [Bacteroidales bacterium]|nr:amidohydrolase [Bacteroidales bacterium]
MSIYIKNVLLDEKTTNILIHGNKIAGIGIDIEQPTGANVIDGQGKAAFPTFANSHGHAAMSLFRGFGDDHNLGDWLNQWIWPNERNLDPEIIYWGVRLACLEMIKSGTTAFADMYFFLPDAAKAVEESGIRAILSHSFVDLHNPDMAKSVRKEVEGMESIICDWNSSHERTKLSIAPHAIYTVSNETLKFFAEFCTRHNLIYHIHMSETLTEVENSLKENGCRPYELMERLGILEQTGSRFIGAHSLHLSPEEIGLIGKYHCNVAHNPNSNLKLASGHQFFYNELRDAGVNVALGTDGCSSSNNLDMIEAAKVMSLLQKGWRQDPLSMPAPETLKVATRNGFTAMGIDAGELSEGHLADLMLVDLNNIAFVPNNNSTSNLIYAAHGDCVDTVICNGNIVMQGRKVAEEENVIREAQRVVKKLITVRPA